AHAAKGNPRPALSYLVEQWRDGLFDEESVNLIRTILAVIRRDQMTEEILSPFMDAMTSANLPRPLLNPCAEFIGKFKIYHEGTVPLLRRAVKEYPHNT